MYSLALVVIARNEAPRIRRLLDSVRPFVDRMLVLDTGSVDDTVALAQAAGARVERFEWCADFSAARNRALTLAGADWHLVLDADEWLEEGGEELVALRDVAPDFVGAVEMLDHFEGGTAHQILSRVLPGEVRYVGRVHEQPRHALPVRRIGIRVGHDGYSNARLLAKRGRNRELLEHMLAETPGDAYLLYQLGKDCAVYDEHAGAEHAFARAAAVVGPTRPSWWFDLVARRLYELKCLHRHAQGVQFAEEEMATCAGSPDFFFALGDLLLDFAAEEPERAPAVLPMAEAAWRQCLELGEHPEQVGAVAGRGSSLAVHNLVVLLNGTGRESEAKALAETYGL
ncbi:MAG: glycosyltransferase [Paucibacter sp.]|nr:glycosyltransferase [Roseateles sp.]